MLNIFVLSLVMAMTLVSADAFAGRNNFEFGNPTFNNRFGTVGAQNNLEEANNLMNDAQERKDDAESEERSSSFLVRSSESEALQRAQDSLFSGNPGDSGQGTIGDQTYEWEVTATNYIFRIDGEEVFNILCDGGAC